MRIVKADRPSGRGTVPFSADFRVGVQFFFRNSTLRTMLISVCLYTLGVGALNVLDVFFVTMNLHVSASWLGVVGAGFAVGSIVGALLSAAIVARLGDRRTLWLCQIITGIVILVYSRMTLLPVAIVVLALAGIPVAAVNVVAGPVLLKVTPEKLIGRVMAVMGPIQQLTGIVGMAVAGFVASSALRGMNTRALGLQFGPINTIFGAGALLMISGGLWASRRLEAATSENIDETDESGDPRKG